MLSLPIPLLLLLAAQPELVTAVLQAVQWVVMRHLLGAAGLNADEGHDGAVTLIQRFGSAAKLNIQWIYVSAPAPGVRPCVSAASRS